MAIPNLVYNEERPQFIGKDVEGIKELNQTLAHKYDINKQAKIQTEDLLHSFNTLDKDAPHLTEAIQGFDEELQYIADNNQYERAGQVVEKAVTNIKRNKALEQSVANYGAYQSYVDKLKTDPKGWTANEISSVIGFSSDMYSGVSLDENGQATGTFYGYDPGEKINTLKEFDEALKGFASDKGVSIGSIYNVLEDGSRKGFDKVTTEQISRDEIITYLKQYYNNDPKINKYYETKSILDSRKSAQQLNGEIYSNIDRLDLMSAYGPKYKRFLKESEGITAENQAIDGLDFMQWMLNNESGANYDIKGLMQTAAEGGPDANLAKQKLAEMNSMMNKTFDLEAAAIKNGFTKTDVKRSTFADQMSIYRLKKLEDNTDYLYTMDGSAVDYSSQFTSDKGGYKLLDEQVGILEGQLEVKQTQIDDKLKDAIGVGDYDDITGVWTNPNSIHKVDYDRYSREKNMMDQELAMKDNYLSAADNYANEQLNTAEGVSPERVARTQERMISNINTRKQELQQELDLQARTFERLSAGAKIIQAPIYNLKHNKLQERIDGFDRHLKDINEKGVQRFANDLSEEVLETGFAGLPALKKDVLETRQRAKQYKQHKQDYLDSHSIRTEVPNIVHIDPEANKQMVRAMDVVEEHFATNSLAYVVRDQDGNIINNPKDRPSFIDINGMSNGRFSDGDFYYEATAQAYNDDGKLVPAINKDGSAKKYYVSAPAGSVNNNVGAMLVHNTNPKAAALGYELIQPLGFRFKTEGINLANNAAPITSDDGNQLGTVEINSSETNGLPDFQDTRIVYNIPASILKQIQEINPDITSQQIFRGKAAFESFINDVNQTVNANKK